VALRFLTNPDLLLKRYLGLTPEGLECFWNRMAGTLTDFCPAIVFVCDLSEVESDSEHHRETGDTLIPAARSLGDRTRLQTFTDAPEVLGFYA
jgi:hypothetical protein